jgi:hypothetical protein
MVLFSNTITSIKQMDEGDIHPTKKTVVYILHLQSQTHKGGGGLSDRGCVLRLTILHCKN